MILKRLHIALFVLLGLSGAQSQDVHFSQFYSYAANLNPALTGYFNGDYRATLIHRNQWRTVTTPYVSYAASFDAHNFLRTRNWGTGISFSQDQAGDSHLKTTQASLAQSYFLQLNQYQSHYIGFGLQLDYVSRSIDYTQLSFDHQYNGRFYDPSRPTGEEFMINQRNYLNLNTGLTYLYQFDKRNAIIAGVSWYNINNPKQTFFADANVVLDTRQNFHFMLNHMANANLDIVPSLLFSQQGHFREILAGVSAKFLMEANAAGEAMFVVGTWYRFSDAAIVAIRMDNPRWRVGLSYDFNLSTLKPASNGLGGFEISATYMFRRIKGRRKYNKGDCPIFI